ncbi:hypothetical protein [uncultured Kriegella sp.]|uniref:hypothetical protein n=1 Tax=uncultured Kriegella sp. TaxID=1798910 RepID=UPI0030D761A5|tara:strand:+ start:90523 stop:90930 length:408 start_codon:yes stop_codon:yes gene_type:complete
MNNTETIKRLSELFEEAIIMLPDDDIANYVKENPNNDFNKHIMYIKRLNTKAKSEMQQSLTNKAKEILESLISEIGKNQFVETLLTQPKYQKLAPQLFSKFENISDKDKEEMLKDKRFMELVRELKEDLKNEGNS